MNSAVTWSFRVRSIERMLALIFSSKNCLRLCLYVSTYRYGCSDNVSRRKRSDDRRGAAPFSAPPKINLIKVLYTLPARPVDWLAVLNGEET